MTTRFAKLMAGVAACLSAATLTMAATPEAGGQAGGGQGGEDQDIGRARATDNLHGSAAYRHVIGGSACQLDEPSKDKIRASGDCPGKDQTCTLQERGKGSKQDWKDSDSNPALKDAHKEYRPKCVKD